MRAWGCVLGVMLLSACTSDDDAAPAARSRAAPVIPAETPQVGTLPAGVSADDVARGRETYGTVCVACHGPDARGTQLGPALVGDSASSATSSIDSVTAVIREGVADGQPLPMPAYAGILDDASLRAVAAYVAALHKR